MSNLYIQIPLIKFSKFLPLPYPVKIRKKKGLTNKYCHAELDSASTLYTVHRFRNEFGMTLRNELFGQQPKYSKLNQIIFL